MPDVYQLSDEDPALTPTTNRRTLKWHARGFADNVAADAGVRAVAPPYYAGLPITSFDSTRPPGGDFVFTAVHAATFDISPPPPATAPGNEDKLGGSVAFTVGGGTVRLLRSFETVERRDRQDDSAPSFRRNVGVTLEKVEGVEVPAPKYEWSYTGEFQHVTPDYLKTVGKLVGRTNRADFRTRTPEECLLVRVNGQWQSGERWKVTFDFWDGYTETIYKDTPANRTAHPDAEFPPEEFDVASVTKRGWHYLWFAYRKKTVGTAPDQYVIDDPFAFYVERVFRTGDFSKLGVG